MRKGKVLKSYLIIGMLFNTALAFSQNQSDLQEEISNIESIKINKDDLDIETRRGGRVLVIRESSESVNFEAYSIHANPEFIKSMLTTLKEIQNVSLSLNLLRTYSDSNFYSSFLNCGCETAPKRVIESYKNNWTEAENRLSRLNLPTQDTPTSQTIVLEEKIETVLAKLSEVDKVKIFEEVGYNFNDIIDFIARDNIPANEREIENLYQAVEELKSSIVSFMSFVNLLN